MICTSLYSYHGEGANFWLMLGVQHNITLYHQGQLNVQQQGILTSCSVEGQCFVVGM